MKIEKYSVPQSSFLAMEKDTALIVDMMLKNERLKKLLYYPTRDCLEKPNLTEDQTLSLIGNQIKTIPKIFVNNEDLIYVLINFDGYTPNFTNPEFRNNIITFDVVCNVDNWQLKDFQLRPYRIAAELDTMFSNKHLTGIGTLNFTGGLQVVMSPEHIGLNLSYLAIHGGEDKYGMPNVADEEQFIQDYNKMYNQD